MNTEFNEIRAGLSKTLSLIDGSEKRILGIASAIMLVTGVLTNLPAVILGRLVDQLTATSAITIGSIAPFILLIIGIILIREALTVLRKYQVENIATQTEKKQTVATISRLLHTDSQKLEGFRVGALHGRIFRSIEGLVRLIKLSFLDFLPAAFSAAAALAIALISKPLIATVMLLVIPAGLYIIVKQIGSQKGIRIALLRGKEATDATVVEVLGGIETVRSLDTTGVELARIETSAETLRQREIKHHLQMALYDAAKYLNEGFFYILVICLSIYLASQGIISKGDILVYSILFLSITAPLRQIHRILDEAHESSIRVEDLYQLQQQPIDPAYTTPDTKQVSQAANSAITIKNLSYHYPSRPERSVLNNITLTIPSGEKLGIAGASGCGKSTLIKLLLRLHHGYEGSIHVLGQDLATLNRHALAQTIAYIPQKTYLFSGTIRENIEYGTNRKHSNDEIRSATKKAQIWDEIEHSLGGMNGKVTEQGNNLSGGQKQRLAIARIILQAPDILFFDEATSALDNRNEAAIQKTLEEIFKDKTMITVAHRLSTLRNADRILVFDAGAIVQEGTYTELAKTDGLFKTLLGQT